ncbi:MAG: OmpA family protein [Burkholderiales bacterium]|nr:OmpA family protein [Burkholderiales bacterium]
MFFELGGAQLTADSAAQLDTVIQQATARPGGEIVVIGHTDRVGTMEANDLLSLQRAQAIRELLIQRGFPRRAPRRSATASGSRWWRPPDEVAEPRNRRVEIVVR